MSWSQEGVLLFEGWSGVSPRVGTVSASNLVGSSEPLLNRYVNDYMPDVLAMSHYCHSGPTVWFCTREPRADLRGWLLSIEDPAPLLQSPPGFNAGQCGLPFAACSPCRCYVAGNCRFLSGISRLACAYPMEIGAHPFTHSCSVGAYIFGFSAKEWKKQETAVAHTPHFC